MTPIRTVLHTYSFRDYPLDHVLAFAHLDGWPAIELAACHLDGGDPSDILARAATTARRLGITIHCAGYWGTFATADAGSWQRSVDAVCATIAACARAGVTLVNGSGGWLVDGPVTDGAWGRSGSALADEHDLRRVADAYRLVGAFAAERGVRVLVEVHPHTVHDTVAATTTLLDLIGHDNVGVTLDPSNAAALTVEDRDPAVIGTLTRPVSYFHLKNCTVRRGAADFSTDAATGLIDNFRWLERLARADQPPAVCIEYCGDGDPHPRVTAARRYLDDTLRIIAAA